MKFEPKLPLPKKPYTVLRAIRHSDGKSQLLFDEVIPSELDHRQLYIRTLYSTINFKDLLRIRGVQGISRHASGIPGIDAVGVVVKSNAQDSYKEGDFVLITSSKYGVSKSGCFSEMMIVDSSEVLPLPKQMSPFFSMFLGTAGLTAAHIANLIVRESEEKARQAVYINGASSSLGLLTTCLLTYLGYEVIAGIRSEKWRPLLLNIGASDVRVNVHEPKAIQFQILPARWSIVIDILGGQDLPRLAALTSENGIIYQAGNLLGNTSNLSLAPFFTRGISICGIATETLRPNERSQLWELLATEWQPAFRVASNFTNVIPFLSLKDYLYSLGPESRNEVKTIIAFS